MIYFRKPVDNDIIVWKTMKLSPEEVKMLKEKTINTFLNTYKQIQDKMEKNNITLSDQCLSVLLEKVCPSYYDLANDFLEITIDSENKK